jgi:hypothetical protein
MMIQVSRGLMALCMVAAISTVNLAVCAGWAPTPEARISCCTGEGCPMHKTGGSQRLVVTQADADKCCALSEDTHRSSSLPTYAPGLSSLASALPLAGRVNVTAVPHGDITPMSVPVRAASTARYVLLSIFLV